MYNIDFRVNGEIVSIPICYYDTLGKLVKRMKGVEKFDRYDDKELEEKVMKSLKAILARGRLEGSVRERIMGLVNGQEEYAPTNDSEYSMGTIPHIPQDCNNIQTDTQQPLAVQHNQSTRRLTHNYNLPSSQQSTNSYYPSLQPQDLKFKYDLSEQQQQSLFQQPQQPKRIINNNNSIYQQYETFNKREYHQQQQQNDNNNSINNEYPTVNMRRKGIGGYQQQKLFSRGGNISNLREIKDHDPVKGKRQSIREKLGKSLSLYNNNNNSKETQTINKNQRKQLLETMNNNNITFNQSVSKSISQQRILSRNTTQRRANIDHLVSLTYKRPFQERQSVAANSIFGPKHDQIVDRGRSLSEIYKKDHMQSKRLQRHDLNRSNISQTKLNAGKIQHHRRSYNGELSVKHTDNSYKENYNPSKSKLYTFNNNDPSTTTTKYTYDPRRSSIANDSSSISQPLQLKNNNYPLHYNKDQTDSNKNVIRHSNNNKKVYSYL